MISATLSNKVRMRVHTTNKMMMEIKKAKKSRWSLLKDRQIVVKKDQQRVLLIHRVTQVA
jgi:hypothetical protein